jgi:hypothetical protein
VTVALYYTPLEKKDLDQNVTILRRLLTSMGGIGDHRRHMGIPDMAAPQWTVICIVARFCAIFPRPRIQSLYFRTGIKDVVTSIGGNAVAQHGFPRAFATGYTVVRETPHRVSVSSAHPGLFSSTVVAAGKGGHPRHCSGASSRIRQLAAFCLLLEKNPPPISDIIML